MSIHPIKRKPNISIVAKHAGVAVSTVSRFLNGHYVSADARSRIAASIAELGFSRSSTARNLSLGRRGSIGVVVDSSQDPWFTRLLAGIEEELSQRDCSLMLASTELTGKYDPTIVFEWVREHKVDGLVLAKSQRRDRALIRAAVNAQLPTVLIAPDETAPQVQLVRCDNRSAGVAVANHLVDLGHRVVAFAGGPAHSIDSKHRLIGLRDGLADRGIELQPNLIFSCGSWEADAGAAFARTSSRMTAAQPQWSWRTMPSLPDSCAWPTRRVFAYRVISRLSASTDCRRVNASGRRSPASHSRCVKWGQRPAAGCSRSSTRQARCRPSNSRCAWSSVKAQLPRELSHARWP